jgi:hypothetical protein
LKTIRDSVTTNPFSIDVPWFRDVQLEDLAIAFPIPATARGTDPDKIDGSTAPASGRPDRAMRLSVARFAIEGNEPGLIRSIEVRDLLGEVRRKAGPVEGRFSLGGMRLSDLDTAYYGAIMRGAFEGALARTASDEGDKKATPALSAEPVAMSRDGPLSAGFSALEVGPLQIDIAGAQFTATSFRYIYERDETGLITSASAPRVILGLSVTDANPQTSSVGAALRQMLDVLGYPEGLRLFLDAGVTRFDPKADTFDYSGGAFEWENGLRVAFSMRFADAMAYGRAMRTPAIVADTKKAEPFVRISGGVVEVSDLGALSRIAAAAARQQGGLSPQALRDQWAAQSEQMLAGQVQDEEPAALQAIRAGLAAFIRQGGVLTITAAPTAPIGLDQLNTAQGKGWKQLNLKTVHKPGPAPTAAVASR